MRLLFHVNDVGFHLCGKASSGESCSQASLPWGVGRRQSQSMLAAGIGIHGYDFQPPRGASFLSQAMDLHLHSTLPCLQASLLAIGLSREHSPSPWRLEPIIIRKVKSISATFLSGYYGLQQSYPLGNSSGFLLFQIQEKSRKL